MSLMLAEATLTERIRSRMAEGAAIAELAEAPAWLAAELADQPVRALFRSEYAHVAILEDGRTLVRRVRG